VFELDPYSTVSSNGDSSLFGPVVPAIEFEGVCLAYDDNVILDHIDLKVGRGDCKIILGRSGGGKSTIIRLILGLLKPDSGRILIDGEDITDYSEADMMSVRQKIGMVFQEGALFDSISVYENVAYRLREQHRSEDEIEKRSRGCWSLSTSRTQSTRCRSSCPAACAVVLELRVPS
jgi:phospholipid/cholesterol/gamma-HCH transport system ATP-binding protein